MRFSTFSSQEGERGALKTLSPQPLVACTVGLLALQPVRLLQSGGGWEATAGANCTSPVSAAMPTLFPWQWAPNGRLPGKAKMPEK